jgi:Methyltransferase domain
VTDSSFFRADDIGSITGPNSVQNPFRAKRVRDVAGMCEHRNFTRIVDLGGTPEFWCIWQAHFDWTRVNVTCVNPTQYTSAMPNVICIQGDATDLDFADQSFDIAFSNSVIEHVGRANRAAFAREASRVADRLYIQTPDYWFPIEAHARLPGFQWLPRRARAVMLRLRHWGFLPKAATWQEALNILRQTDLLTFCEMQTLFPDARIERERFLGFSKALVAIR